MRKNDSCNLWMKALKKRLLIDCGSSEERVKRLLTADLRITLAFKHVCKKKST